MLIIPYRFVSWTHNYRHVYHSSPCMHLFSSLNAVFMMCNTALPHHPKMQLKFSPILYNNPPISFSSNSSTALQTSLHISPPSLNPHYSLIPSTSLSSPSPYLHPLLIFSRPHNTPPLPISLSTYSHLLQLSYPAGPASPRPASPLRQTDHGGSASRLRGRSAAPLQRSS